MNGITTQSLVGGDEGEGDFKFLLSTPTLPRRRGREIAGEISNIFV
jgi:hypothetical protein